VVNFIRRNKSSFKFCFFTDAYNGYIGGEAGTIFKTTDGGNSWTTYSSGIVLSIESLYFTDSITGYAVGSSIILKTTNAGITWNGDTTGIDALNDIYFTDDNTGYAIGYHGVIYKTINAGVSWYTLTSGIESNLYSISFTDANTCYAVGDMGTIIKSNIAGSLTPPLFINQLNDTSICINNQITFNATAIGTPALSYQWQYKNSGIWSTVTNGIPTGTLYTNQITPVLDIDSISSPGIYQYRCIVTNNYGADTSNIVTLTINPIFSVGINIIASENPTCIGSNVIYTATQTNGGTMPTYQWKLNGNNIGTNDSTFSSSTIANNDILTCILTSNANCVIANSDTSNAITMTVYPLYSNNNPKTICQGDSYILNGHTYTIAGTYNDTLLTISGCDSIIVTQLIVNPVFLTNNPQTICAGNSYVLNGHTYSTTGTYTDTLISITGCDSIIVTQLTVNPTYSTNNTQTICNGNSYDFNGHTYISAGMYLDTLSTVLGCDSIIVTQLTVNPVYSINNPQVINTGGSYIFNGNTYTLPGTYYDTLSTINGCDSIFITQLIVNPANFLNLDSLNGGINDTLYVSFFPLTLNAGNGFLSYLWSNGSNVQTTQVNSNGWYSVTVSDGSKSTQSDSIYVLLITNEPIIDSQNEIKIYPNPNTGKFIISVNGNIKIDKLEIYNVIGDKVYSIKTNNNYLTYIIDLTENPKGIYFIKIYSREKIYIEKIVKQ